MKNFILIGAAGYVAPRHMKAIKETGNNLIAAFDPNDSVGIIDSYFPKADFFTEFERFDRHIEKLKRQGISIDYLSVCSPNYLHDAHIRFGLRHGADVICEKPLVLNPWNIEALDVIEKETKKNIFTVLQLRLHPAIIKLKEKIAASPKDKVFDVDLTYITSRGNWYYTSWKGDESKSGGIVTNIAIHFFDMLLWLFGDVKTSQIHVRTHDRAGGYLELANARIKWFVSINSELIPKELGTERKRTFRALSINDDQFDFSSGFENLHTLTYEEILKGDGFKIEEASKAIDLVHGLRKDALTEKNGNEHPLSRVEVVGHPFEKEQE